MRILVECSECNNSNSLKVNHVSVERIFVSYRINVFGLSIMLTTNAGERTGPSKMAAENRLHQFQTAKAEGTTIRKNKNALITLGNLRDWYLDLTEVKLRRSFSSIKKCLRISVAGIGDIPVSQLTQSRPELFRKKRLTEISVLKGRPVQPSAVIRVVANLRTMLNKAVLHSKLDTNPIGRIRHLEENNVLERVLDDEFEKLYQSCPASLKGPVLIGSYLPMKQAEIFNLTWQEINLKMGFIRLGGDRTKNKTGRVIPLHQRIIEFLKSCPRPIHGGYVFGESRPYNRKTYNKAVKAVGIVDFNFHDLRHCAINNLRLARNDHFVIKQASGAKTNSAFQRYNLVTEEKIKSIK